MLMSVTTSSNSIHCVSALVMVVEDMVLLYMAWQLSFFLNMNFSVQLFGEWVVDFYLYSMQNETC